MPQGRPCLHKPKFSTAPSEWIAMPGNTNLSKMWLRSLPGAAALGWFFCSNYHCPPIQGSRHVGLRFVVCNFALVQLEERGGMHPEIVMLSLKRNNTLRITDAADILERIHVIALRGNHGRPAGAGDFASEIPFVHRRNATNPLSRTLAWFTRSLRSALSWLARCARSSGALAFFGRQTTAPTLNFKSFGFAANSLSGVGRQGALVASGREYAAKPRGACCVLVARRPT